MKFTTKLEEAMDFFSKTGGFFTVKKGEQVNTMTVSWGFIGYMWAKPMFVAVIRPQRFTKTILDKTDNFTISIPFGTMKDELVICGTKSGADIDKSKVVNFIDSKTVESSIVEGCDIFYECKIHHVEQLNGSSLPEEIKTKFYNEDYHFVYYGEIVDCYEK